MYHVNAVPQWVILLFFPPRHSMNLKQNNIKNVLMTTWKCLMVKVKNLQSWDACVATKYQILSLLLGTKCFFALFLMHQFKEKASKQLTLQVRNQDMLLTNNFPIVLQGQLCTVLGIFQEWDEFTDVTAVSNEALNPVGKV